MDTIQIVRSTEADDRQIQRIVRQHNRLFMREFGQYSYHVEDNGAVVAGIVAASTFDTVEVEYLGVEAAYRGQGLGARLLRHVEALARADGMRRILLNTYSFQAPGFYDKMGYRTLFTVSPCFAEYAQYYYEKVLDGGVPYPQTETSP